MELDLARRDFTVNAMAWGAEPGSEPRFVDPHDGQADLAARTLRAVGDPSCGSARTRCAWSGRSGCRRHSASRRARHARRDRVERRARRAPVRRAHRGRDREAPRSPVAVHRVPAARGYRSARSPRPRACRATGRAPEQGPGRGPVGPHAARSRRRRLGADPHPAGGPAARLAKPATMADGRFVGHEILGAQQARDLLDRWRWRTDRARPRRPSDPPPHVRVHADLVRRCDPSVHREGRGRCARRPVPPA